MPRARIIICLLSLNLSLMCSATPARAATTVEVKAGRTVTITLPRNPRIVGVEDPAIATLELLQDGRGRVSGKRPGKTRIIGRDFAEVPFIIAVRVHR